jgi:hypothetical protein
MLQRLIVAVIILAMVYSGFLVYQSMFVSDNSVDARLAGMTLEEIQLQSDTFDNHVLNFELVEPGTYMLEVTGINSPQDAGRIGYNALVVLDGQNIKLKTPRHTFTIMGYQDGILIFEIHYENNMVPQITLHGPYEGVEYSPSFSSRPSMPGDYGHECRSHA